MAKQHPPSKSLPRRYFKEVRFRQIRAVVALARQGSFASAAASLGLAVPSIWQQIRALEDEYRVQLVVAKGAHVSLTEDGRRLVDLASPLVEGFDSLRSLFEDRGRAASRTLTVVAPAPMLSGALWGPIIDYRTLHPAVNLRLLDRPSLAARRVLESEEADLAIIGLAEGDEPLPQFEIWPLARFPFQLICPRDHPLATADPIALSDILQHPLVLSGEDSSSYRQIRHTVTEAGLAGRMNVAMTATNRTLLLGYVSIGFGIALGTSAASTALPQPTAGQKQLVIRDVALLFGHEEVILLQRKGRHELPHVKAFRDLVLEGQSAQA
jgi:DNA-binding transcriptional LysR family regulator